MPPCSLAQPVYPKPTKSGWRRGGSHPVGPSDPGCGAAGHTCKGAAPRRLTSALRCETTCCSLSFYWWYRLREKSHCLGQLACKEVSQMLIEILSKLPPTEATGHTLCSTEPIGPQESSFQETHIETTVPKTQSGNSVCLLHIYF